MNYHDIFDGRKIRVFLAFVIFIYTFTIQNKEPNYGYYIYPDTQTYINTTHLAPWKSHRMPGYPLICSVFFTPEKRLAMNGALRKHSYEELYGKEHKIEKLMADVGLKNTFTAITLLQRFSQAIAISVFFLAICCFFPPTVAAVSIGLALWLIPLANPYNILSEPIFQALLFFCLSCLLFFRKTERFIWLYLGCISALCSYALRTVGLSMVGLCFICLAYFFIRDRFRHPINYSVNFGILALSVAYIVYLSASVGSVTFATHPGPGITRPLFFLETADVKNMPTKRSELFAQTFLDENANFVNEYGKAFNWRTPDGDSNFSLPRLYANLADIYYYGASGRIFKTLVNNERFGRLNVLEKNKLGAELNKGVLERHKVEYMELVFKNFLCGLGFYEDLRVSTLVNILGGKVVVFLMGCLCLAIIVCKNERFCLLLLVFLHLCNISAVSFGHFIQLRYVQITEIFLPIAIALSIFCVIKLLGESVFPFLKKLHDW